MGTIEKSPTGSGTPEPAVIEGLESIEELESIATPDVIVWGQL
ncbi:MAG TPA: hypothetical protein VE422_20780 [Terriglobia bacterium]|nr:hypothetical protein [Terriglobia bacterium]